MLPSLTVRLLAITYSRHRRTKINAGSVRGAQGVPGPAALKLDDVGDVNAPTPTDKQLLGFDLASHMWVPMPAGLTMDQLTDVDATSPTQHASLWFNTLTSRWVLGPEMLPIVGKTDLAAALTLGRSGSNSTSLVDGTGNIQLGANGGPNIGISQNVIQCRNAGVSSPLILQNSGGITDARGGLNVVGNATVGSALTVGGLITSSGLSSDSHITATAGNITANVGSINTLANTLNINSVATHCAIFNTDHANGPYIAFRRNNGNIGRVGITTGSAGGNAFEILSEHRVTQVWNRCITCWWRSNCSRCLGWVVSSST